MKKLLFILIISLIACKKKKEPPIFCYSCKHVLKSDTSVYTIDTLCTFAANAGEYAAANSLYNYTTTCTIIN